MQQNTDPEAVVREIRRKTPVGSGTGAVVRRVSLVSYGQQIRTNGKLFDNLGLRRCAVDVFDRIPRATVASWPSVLAYPVVRCAMVECQGCKMKFMADPIARFAKWIAPGEGNYLVNWPNRAALLRPQPVGRAAVAARLYILTIRALPVLGGIQHDYRLVA